MVRSLFQRIKSIRIKPIWLGIIVGVVATHVFWMSFAFVMSKIEWDKSDKVAQKAFISSNTSPSPSPKYLIGSSEIEWINPSRTTLEVFKSSDEIQSMIDNNQSGGWTGFGIEPGNVIFFKVANLKDGGSLIRASDVSFTNIVYFLVRGNSITAILTGYKYERDDLKYVLRPEIKILNGEIEGLKIQKSISVNYLNFEIQYSSLEDWTTTNNKMMLSNLGSEVGQLYVAYNFISGLTGIFNRDFYLKQPDGTGVKYGYVDKMSIYDNGVQKIKWLDGSDNQDQFISMISNDQCGASYSKLVIKSKDFNSDRDGVVVGNTDSGDPVFKFKNNDRGITKHLYGHYRNVKVSGRDDLPLVSIEDFSNDNNYFIWRDGIGDWQIWINQKYATMAECGKPVIYLYPEKDQLVNVQVEANINKSEPLYPENGWNVLAKPNGDLIYKGNMYQYLFWEGLGKGIYPEVKSRGFVAEKKDIENTLRLHLKLLGLNYKETSDFLDFWLPKMPNTPYIKLTWLNTGEMDKLAPLVVNPKPDTKIRVFLDFQGLEKKVNLEPQKLIAPERRGFTLVEWGGLLIY